MKNFGLGNVINTKDIVSVGIFTALMAVLSQISVPLPFTPVPLTLSLFTVYLSAAVLGFRRGLFVQIVYILLGAVGFPVFSGFSGGLAHLFGPTGGYILSYLIMAALIGAFSDRISDPRSRLFLSGRNPVKMMIPYALIFTAALVICYSLGSLWLSWYLNISFQQGFLIGALPYIPLDIMKIAACAMIIIPVRRSYLNNLSHRS